MAKVDMTNLLLSLALNNEKMKQYVYETITRFSPTAVNVARILSHMSNTSIHISREDKELWSSSFDRAKQYMDEKFKSMSTIELKKVTSLPTTNISSSTIYLVPSSAGHDVYEQYVYSDGKWVSLGSTTVDMENYYTKNQIDDIVKTINSTAKHTHVNQDILDLITAPFTIADKKTLDTLGNVDLGAFTNHINDASLHLNANDRETLRKLASTGIDHIAEHISNELIHLTAQEKAKYDSYLQTMTDKVNELLENVLHIELVNELPAPKDAVDKTIYCIPLGEDATEKDVFHEWLFIGGGYEKISGNGSSSGNQLPDLSNFITTSDLQTYFESHSHQHTNFDILNRTNATYTIDVQEKIIRTENTLSGHTADTSIHLTQRQTDLIEVMNDLEPTVENLVKTIINNTYFDPDNEDSTVPNPMTNFTKLLVVTSLPTVYKDIHKQAIYLVPVSKIVPSDDKLTSNSDIRNVPKSMGDYDMYIWSDTYNCWEKINGFPCMIVDKLPTNVSDVKRNMVYFVRNNTPISENPPPNDESEISLGINRCYDKYIWNNEMSAWEVIYESPSISYDEVDYILGRS